MVVLDERRALQAYVDAALDDLAPRDAEIMA
jgi:hypothetical protein